MPNYKIKAGALQFTLFIAVVIALLLSGFILLVHSHKRFSIQTDFVKETIANANKGITYAMGDSYKIEDTLTVDLKDEDYKSLKVHTAPWGIYDKVISTAKIKTNSYSKIALLGSHEDALKRTALYLQDNNRPLVLVGNTKIEGLCYLPKQGVKPGTIAGQSYYGNQLIYGQKRVSGALPKLSNKTLDHLRKRPLITRNLSGDYDLNYESGKVYANSFLKPLQVIRSHASITLVNTTLIGNIIVQSDTKISVDASAILKDVILIAPEIEIKQRVKGSFQAIATKKVLVESYCTLDYPSALILVAPERVMTDNAQNQNHPTIEIKDHTELRGSILYLGSQPDQGYKANVLIEEKAKVIGELYCNKNLELLGTVYGSVYTSNFITNKAGSIYQNHIYDGSISSSKLQAEYVGLPLDNTKQAVVKWLY